MKGLVRQALLSGASPYLEVMNASLRNLEMAMDKLAAQSERNSAEAFGERAKISVLIEKTKDVFASLESCLD